MQDVKVNGHVEEMAARHEKVDALVCKMEEQIEKELEATGKQKNVSMAIKDDIANLQRCFRELRNRHSAYTGRSSSPYTPSIQNRRTERGSET